MKPTGRRAERKTDIADRLKLIAAWITGIVGALLFGTCGVLVLAWLGATNGHPESEFANASTFGLVAASLTIGLRSGCHVFRLLTRRHIGGGTSAWIHEQALLRGITLGALVFMVFTLPLDMLSLPGTTWLAAAIYLIWSCAALALAIGYGNFIYFHNTRTATKAKHHSGQ